jgi:hypothetical protein
MTRRTPQLAMLLAPFALLGLLLLWDTVLRPLYISVWHGETTVTQALQDVVLMESDDVTLSAAINALGQAAARNACPDAMMARIAGIFDESHLPWMNPRAAEALGRSRTCLYTTPITGAAARISGRRWMPGRKIRTPGFGSSRWQRSWKPIPVYRNALPS